MCVCVCVWVYVCVYVCVWGGGGGGVELCMLVGGVFFHMTLRSTVEITVDDYFLFSYE